MFSEPNNLRSLFRGSPIASIEFAGALRAFRNVRARIVRLNFALEQEIDPWWATLLSSGRTYPVRSVCDAAPSPLLRELKSVYSLECREEVL